MPTVIQKRVRELTVEETFSWTFNIYSKNFIIFFVPMLLGGLTSEALSHVINTYLASELLKISLYYDFRDALLAFLGIFIVLLLLLMLVSWVVGTITQGTCIKCASLIVEKGEGDLAEAFQNMLHKLPSLLVANLIVTIAVAVGLIALIIPGIIIYIMYFLVLAVILNENMGVMNSLARSKKLVDRRWLQTFAVILIVFLVTSLVNYIASIFAAPLGAFSWMVSGIISSFVTPLVPITVAVYYYSMIGREQAQTVPLPPPPPF
ncbi:MAG: hypothetical protein QHH24_03975 [Candidatus Bathyarchaeota archaeon]|jgi:hypothetical protein|nr:hypothetical protein [Candidatus Bathyarchaeota archaeon]